MAQSTITLIKKDPGKPPAKKAPAPNNKKSTTINSNRGQTTGSKSSTNHSDTRRWLFSSKPSKPSTTTNTNSRQIISTSASAPSLSSNDNSDEINNKKSKSKRPLTILGTINNNNNNITLRRGQQQQQQQQSSKSDGQLSEDLSRASSVTNLNDNNGKSNNKGAKPKKAESKDKLDKIVELKKHDKIKTSSLINSRNNNKVDLVVVGGGDSATSAATLMDVEVLQKQLAQMANEKSTLALQLGEQTGQLHQLTGEVAKLTQLQDEANRRLEQLLEENSMLRNRLRDVAHSPLSDNEKQQLLYDSSHRHHSSAPASIATNLLDDGGGDVTACPTPEWDKHSSSNVSEVSVACLQDKINQMQETHYSTNEELQATLQELTDLQRQLTELQQENVRLNDEKGLMFESLCRQTERLNDSRNEVESLKQLLYKDDSGQFETAAEREQKLVDLLKSAQEERESLLVKQEQLGNDLEESRSENLQHGSEIVQLSERVKTLESTLDAKHAEHKQLDQELAQAKDQSSSRQIEINRLKDLLENARTKINELEVDRAMSDKSELDEMLDNARKEKDALESEVAHLKEQLALSRNEIDKLKEQVSILQEECKVTRNNAKTTQSDLEYKVEKLQSDKNGLSEQLQQFQEAINELQVQTQCHLDDKRQLTTVLSETQRNLNESERKILNLEDELAEIKKIKLEQEEEWEKFQNDLLTSVRVANDFKTEAQQDLQKLIMENKAGRDRIKQLEAQIEKLKVATETLPPPIRPTSFQVDDLTTARRPKTTLSRQNSRQSVKSLIESIENAGKPVTKTVSLNSVSRSSSTSSLNSMTSNPSSPIAGPIRTPDWTNEGSNVVVVVKTPLKEQQPNKINRDWSKSINDSLAKGDLVKGKPEDSYRESILQKSIDFSRRNSYSDLSERKDPLNGLVKNGGSKRNALLKWCQNKTVGYRNIDITNFSSSWNDGLALCALLHTYLPDRIPYDSLTQQEKRRNFSLAFSAAESVGIPTTLNINDMIQLERPDWQQVMGYVTAIYKHFET